MTVLGNFLLFVICSFQVMIFHLLALISAFLASGVLKCVVAFGSSIQLKKEATQSCPTLCDPMDGSVPGFSVHGIFHQWVAISFSRRSSRPRDKSSKKLTSSSVSLGEACKFTNISFVIYFSGKMGCAVQLGNL